MLTDAKIAMVHAKKRKPPAPKCSKRYAQVNNIYCNKIPCQNATGIELKMFF